MLIKRIPLTLIIASVACSLFATYPYVRNFSKNVSKLGNQNWDIVQHENQWMYFANNKGLVEFDGAEWMVYPNHNRSVVRSLHYDKASNRLYAGAYNEFGYYSRTANGVMRYQMLNNSPKLKFYSDVWNIHKLNNQIFFQADFDVFVLSNNKMKVYRFDDKINHSAIVNNKLIISQLNKGIRYFDGKTFVDCVGNGLLKKKVVRAILPYGGDKVLFITDVHGIFLYDGVQFSEFKTNIDRYLVNNEVFCAAIKNNFLAIGTVQNGLIAKNLTDNSTVFLNNQTGLQNNTVLSVSFDNKDNLWLGLDNGIDYVMVNSPVSDLIGNSNVVGAGYSSLLYDDKLYLASNQGLYYMNYDTNAHLTVGGVLPVPQIKGQVWNLDRFDDDMFCSCDKGLYVFKQNSITKINDLNGVWNVKPLKVNPNVLLGAEYNEFFIIKKVNGQWRKTNRIRGFNESTKSFIQDNDGDVWVSHTTNGIYRLKMNKTYDAFTAVELFDDKHGLTSLRNIAISEIKGQIVVSTDDGFYYFNRKINRFENHTSMNRLFGAPKYVSYLYVDAHENIWSVASSKIMMALKKGGLSYVVDSMSLSFLNDKPIYMFEHINFLSENKTLIATENGFSLFDNAKRQQDDEPSKLAFKNVRITSPKDSLLSGFMHFQNLNVKPKIKFSNNSLLFEFVCSEYINENSMLYSYLLENYDDEWSVYYSMNRKEYAKIPPGNYNFKVRAKNLNNLNVETLTYAFTILPPWYMGSVAKVVYVLFFFLSIYLLNRLILYRSFIAARNMELKKEEEIKEQEKQFVLEAKEKEKEIIALQNKQLEHELKLKSQDLASSTMNVIRKNEMLLEMNNHLNTISQQIKENKEQQSIVKQIQALQKGINSNIETDNNWVKFQENFDLVYENYLARLGETFPTLSQNDKRICAYLRMNLSSKDIAPLVNTTYQSVEMTRHRLRKKLNLERSVNLTDFLQHF